MEKTFEKIHTCGNDFLLLDWVPDSAQIADLCRPHLGLGADGLMVFQGLDQYGLPLLKHFDPDGSRSLCINGLRAALAVLFTQSKVSGSGQLHYEGQRFEYVCGDSVALTVSPGSVRPCELAVGDGSVSGYFVDTGNPHFLLEGAEVAEDGFVERAAVLRAHADFERGANVHAFWPIEQGWRVRSFERGVEGLTLACGSGILAVASLLAQVRGLRAMRFLPDGGDYMDVAVESDRMVVTGPTHWVASGVWRC
jgi:diaminopimelate epimerase